MRWLKPLSSEHKTLHLWRWIRKKTQWTRYMWREWKEINIYTQHDKVKEITSTSTTTTTTTTTTKTKKNKKTKDLFMYYIIIPVTTCPFNVFWFCGITSGVYFTISLHINDSAIRNYFGIHCICNGYRMLSRLLMFTHLRVNTFFL